jgi:hypothetical protein
VNLCTRLSDRMPAVAQGRDHWSDADQGHLSSCPDCAAEWRLVQATAALGLEVERSIDPAAVNARVLSGLREATSRRRLARRAIWLLPLAAAAALALMLWGGRGVTPAPPSAAGTAISLLPELEPLTTAELQSIMELLPQGADSEDGPRSFDDLTEDEVASVLKDLEG